MKTLYIDCSMGCAGDMLTAALLELLAGLVQLLLFRSLASTSFHLRLSLTPLAVTAALYLLCRWFQQGRALKADNDSII